jgi:hypothetical protein
MLKSGMVGSKGRSICSFWKNIYADFQLLVLKMPNFNYAMFDVSWEDILLISVPWCWQRHTHSFKVTITVDREVVTNHALDFTLLLKNSTSPLPTTHELKTATWAYLTRKGVETATLQCGSVGCRCVEPAIHDPFCVNKVLKLSCIIIFPGHTVFRYYISRVPIL